MRRPPDKDAQPALADRDIDNSNATLNTLFGGTRQKSWMVGAGAPVRPTPRTNAPKTTVPQVTLAQRTNAAVLPSPAPSDEPSPILSNSLPNGIRHENRIEMRNDDFANPNHIRNQQLSSTIETSPATQSGNNEYSNSIRSQQGSNMAGRSLPTQDSENDTQNCARIQQAPRMAEHSSPIPRHATEIQTLPFHSQDQNVQPGNQLDKAMFNANPRAPSTVPEIPHSPISVILADRQTPILNLQSLTPGNHSSVRQEQSGTSSQHSEFRPDLFSSTNLAQLPSTSLTLTQAAPENRQWQSAHTQQLSPSTTNVSPAGVTSSLLSLTSVGEDEAQSCPSPGTFPMNPHKRQRTEIAAMRSLKSRVKLIEDYLISVGGKDFLSQDLELPRFQLLKDACRNEDSFYVALHQIFCLWDSNRNEITSIPGFPNGTVLENAFKILGKLIRDNDRLAPNHKSWFASFPSPLRDLLLNSVPYRRTVDAIGGFLHKLATDWWRLSHECIQRSYPPLVDELVRRMGLLSPCLQNVVFTATRRNLGVREEDPREREIAAGMESLFKRDQRDHQALAARFNTARPPTDKEVQERNTSLKHEYLTLHNQLNQHRQSSTSAAVSLSTRLPPTPVVQSNMHIHPDVSSPGVMSLQQLSGSQTSWQQNVASPDAHGNWQFTNLPPQPISRRVSGSPNALISSHQPGRLTSVGAQRIASTNTPSPTLLQGLNMQSPMQSPMQPIVQSTPVLRSIDNQVYMPQSGPGHAPVNSFYQNGHNTDPSIQHRQMASYQQQQQLSIQQQQVAFVQQQIAVASEQGLAQPELWQHQDQHQNQHPQQQRQQQQQQGPLSAMQQVQQNAQYSQQILNMNRAQQLRQDSSIANESLQRSHSRNNSIGSNSTTGTPVTHHITTQSPRAAAPTTLGPRILGPADQRKAHLINKYIQTPPLQRPLIPPMGYVHPAEQINQEMAYLHQAQVRSPKLVSVEVFPQGIPEKESIAQKDPARRYYQIVKDFAMSPIKVSTNMPLSKYEFTLLNHDFARIPRDFVPQNGEVPTRELRRGALQYRLRCIRTSKSITSCMISDWTVSDTVWPESSSLEINGKALEIRRKNLHGKDLPIDITPYIIGPNSVNRFCMSIIRGRSKMKEYGWFIAVEVIELLHHSQVLEMCHQQRIPASYTLDKIKKSLAGSSGAGDDDDIAIVASDLSIDLADPFTSVIFEIPVRGSTCAHRECFDLDTFLMTRTSRPKRPEQPCMIDVWKCPLCGKDARPYSLQVDDFMVSVRTTLAELNMLDVKTILMSPDGNWRPKEDPKRSHPDEDDGNGSSDEDEKQIALRANQARRRAVEIIELDD